MTPIRVKDLQRLLPEVEDLVPLRIALLRSSFPDPDRTWSGSGELQTAEDRLVDLPEMRREVRELMEGEAAHAERLNRAVQEAITCTASGDRKGAVRALLSAAALEEERGRHERAEAYATSAYGESQELADRRLTALALRRRARAERTQGKEEAALRHYGEAYFIGRAEGDVQGTAEAAIGAGNTAEQGGRWDAAATWYHRALEALRESQDETRPEGWHAALNLHIVDRSIGRIEPSLRWIEKAEEIAKGIEDPDARFFLDNAWGQLHMARDEFDPAGRRFLDALAGSPVTHTPTVRLNLSENLLARGLLLDAAEEARIAEAEAIAGGMHTALSPVYRTLGRCAAAMGNSDAFVLFERALEGSGSEAPNRLQRAMTLQDYAVNMARFQGKGQAEDLLEAAAFEYRALGVKHFRRRWVDCFDVGSTAVPGAEALANLILERSI